MGSTIDRDGLSMRIKLGPKLSISRILPSLSFPGSLCTNINSSLDTTLFLNEHATSFHLSYASRTVGHIYGFLASIWREF